ncbi:MAG TPA: reverse transcriptase-like protein [Candidatus Sulfotelmatobacter sp.]|jgi:ribonuclease HI|nr:reverse transcriptase-like protein [Candidatus Sulfotelmatobacter sp.]
MWKRPSVPKGAGLFGEAEPERKVVAAYQANVDGGSRGNPGPAAYGVVVRDPRGEIVARLKKYIGKNTNNVAEYFGLIAALDYAQNHGIRALRVESDSELMVKQMRGQYKVKSEELKPLFERAKKMSQTFESFRISHVYREQNKEADALVNQALDETSGAGPASSAGAQKPAAKDATMRLVARYSDGVLQPYETLDLPDGTEVELLLRLKK